jgi:hypothetical protein
MVNVVLLLGYQGIYIQGGTVGNQATEADDMHLINTEIDSFGSYGIHFNNVTNSSIDSCWVCNCGLTQAQNGIVFDGTIDSVRIINSSILYNQWNGIALNPTTSTGILISNNNVYDNNAGNHTPGIDGIFVSPGVSNFIIEGNRVTNTSYYGLPGYQQYGIQTCITGSTGCDYYIVTNNLVSGNVITGIMDYGAGTHKNVSNNF